METVRMLLWLPSPEQREIEGQLVHKMTGNMRTEVYAFVSGYYQRGGSTYHTDMLAGNDSSAVCRFALSQWHIIVPLTR